jgi:hypothetical protein
VAPAILIAAAKAEIAIRLTDARYLSIELV